MRGRETVDISIYGKAFAILARNPVIIVFPLLAAVIDIGLGFLRGPIFDPLGGNDMGIFQLLINVIYGYAFALAIIAAETGWRNRRATLSGTWDEGRIKAGSILLAVIGFLFVMFAAGMIGGYFGPLGLVLIIVAAYFLIYTIPAAAIGGVPGAAALSVSIQRVRSNYLGAAVLAIVAIVLYGYVLNVLGQYAFLEIGYTIGTYVLVLLKALIIAYLATVFARQYDEVGFFRPY